VRAEGLSDTLIRKARASGCTYLVVGVESGDQQALDSIVRKGLRLSEVEQMLAACRRERLDTHAFYIVGFPGETRTQIRRTFAFARRMLWRHGTMPHLGLARPLPGTELHAQTARQGYLTAPVRPEIGTGLRGEVFERVMIATPEFSPALLERWVRRFNRQVMVAALVRIVLWLVTHPRAWAAVAGNAWQQRRKRFPAIRARLFFGGLFYKFNYERMQWRAGGATVGHRPGGQHGGRPDRP
jgi:anaerobic magnesium-protoporphyrin IX monomethyl ester cyclase